MKASSAPKTTRADILCAIRDHILPVIQRYGKQRNLGDGMWIVELKRGPFTFMLRTPFARFPMLAPRTYAQALLLQQGAPPLPFGLDIWCNEKVDSFESSDEGAFKMISMRRVAWENEVLEISNQP